jgi:hypothetical protein
MHRYAVHCDSSTECTHAAEPHHTGPPKRPSPDAQLMQPICTSGVMRCCPARFDRGTCGRRSARSLSARMLCTGARQLSQHSSTQAAAHPTVGRGAEVVVALLDRQHGAQDLEAGLPPPGNQRTVCDLLAHQVVKQLS